MKVYNNLTRQLEDFKPLNAPNVTIYSCGPTVYDVSHIGHARSAIVWDVLYRYLNFKSYQVQWARNITNVDDKIINRAREIGTSPDKLSREFTHEFWADMSALNVSWPDHEPRATDYIREMITFIQGLINNGSAYESNGDVYFRVNKHSNYGQLKGLAVDELRKGVSRIDENEKKEDALDFALWKSFPNDADSSFESPWGLGRPGWHLECSTMIHSLFGESIDIHSGGDDLIFPHHENECAQSECLTNKALAKYWMHNGMIMINGRKMSKSENNFLTIKDILGRYKANTIRYFILSTQYKKQINFTHDALKAAEAGFDKLYNSIKSELRSDDAQNKMHSKESLLQIPNLDHELINQFESAMDDDLNTAKALSLIFENKDKSTSIRYLLEVLGFDLVKHENSCAGNSSSSDDALNKTMELILEMRKKARANKDFATSDQIRDALAEANIQIHDYRDKPSEWVIA